MMSTATYDLATAALTISCGKCGNTQITSPAVVVGDDAYYGSAADYCNKCDAGLDYEVVAS